MPAGDIFGLDGIYLNKTNPVTVSVVDINTATSSAGIAVTGGSFSSGTVTLNLSNAAGLTTTPFYVGAIVGVSSIVQAGVAHTGYNGTFVVTGFAGTTTVSYATTGYVGPVATSIGAVTSGYVQLLTDGNVTNTTWSSSQTHGWFGGGTSPLVSTVDRIDFSNDTGTTNIRSRLSSARYQLAATGNSNYGWFGGGSPGTISRIDRIDFSNDSPTASVRGSLSAGRYNLAATGNSNFGWFGGGESAPLVSRVDRIDFSNDSTTASTRGPLSLSRSRFAATGNSNYGWFGGGFPSATQYSTIDRIDFSNDSGTAPVRSVLSSARYGLAATGNSNYGWFGGGVNPGGRVTTIDRIDFSNDSASISPRGTLIQERNNLAATGNSNYGWFAGGRVPTFSIVDRIDFSNDSLTASVRGPLSSARYSIAATSGQARSSSTRLQRGGNFGWFAGGSAPAAVSTVDRIDFSNDFTTASPRGPLTSTTYSLAATGNSNYGWFGGGKNPSIIATVDRIDFSNDSVRASSRGPLSAARYSLAATGNSNYGWFGGGKGTAAPAVPQATVDRINFSNDSVTASPRGPLSSARYRIAATGNVNYGWFGGGYNPSVTPNKVGTVDRINFSNDLATISPRGQLFTARTSLAATGNSNYGWFGGGQADVGQVAVIDRIDFSNDSVTASPRGSLSLSRIVLAATGNSNYGWFGGGYVGGAPVGTSRVDRIDFSNDSASASIRGPIITPATGKFSLVATSNTPVG